jgi:WhiB family redox-sensing transcriptional regulator
MPETRCGTYPGYVRHTKRGEPACTSCKRAAATWRRRLRRSQKGGGTGMSDADESTVDCEDLDLPNQFELPTMRPMPDRSWAQHAACIEHPGAWWFPTNAGASTADARRAVAICEACPVRTECLAHALRHNEPHGIWGGRSERTRRRMRAATRGAA